MNRDNVLGKLDVDAGVVALAHLRLFCAVGGGVGVSRLVRGTRRWRIPSSIRGGWNRWHLRMGRLRFGYMSRRDTCRRRERRRHNGLRRERPGPASARKGKGKVKVREVAKHDPIRGQDDGDGAKEEEAQLVAVGDVAVVIAIIGPGQSAMVVVYGCIEQSIDTIDGR